MSDIPSPPEAKVEPITFRPDPDVADAIRDELKLRPGVIRTFVLNEVLRRGFKVRSKRERKVDA